MSTNVIRDFPNFVLRVEYAGYASHRSSLLTSHLAFHMTLTVTVVFALPNVMDKILKLSLSKREVLVVFHS